MIEVALIAQVGLWLIVIGIFIWSRQASVFHPATVYLAFHGLVFVVRPILVYYCGFDSLWNYFGFKPTDEVFVRTLAVSSLGLVCIVAASILAGRSRTEFDNPAPPTFTAQQRRALLVTTLLLLPLMAYSIYTTRNGVQGERVGGVFIMTNSTGYINEAQDFIMPLLVIWILVTRFHWLNLFPSILYVAYRTWFGWSRWTILLFFLLASMSYCWYHRRKWLPIWSVLAAIPVLLLFNLIGHNRDILRSAITGENTHQSEYVSGMTAEDKFRLQFDTQDFANFDSLSYLVWVVPYKTGDYSYWAQYVQLFTEPIPRILWKDKPVGSPVRTIDINAFGNTTGQTFTLVGDGWMSGGWIGVMVELSLVGMVLGLAHRAFWRNTTHSMGCIVYLVSLAMVPQWYRDGGVVSISKFLLFTVTPVLLWIGIAWLMSGGWLRGYSVMLPAGSRVRIVQTGVGPGQSIER